MSLLTEEQKKRFVEIFKEFDKDKDGIISFEDLGKIFKSIGKNITQEEIFQMETKSESKQIDVGLFLTIMAQKLQEPDDAKEIERAFETFFGSDKTEIPVDEFKNMLMNFGERIAEEEANELINDIGSKNGVIEIKSFIEKVFESN